MVIGSARTTEAQRHREEEGLMVRRAVGSRRTAPMCSGAGSAREGMKSWLAGREAKVLKVVRFWRHCFERLARQGQRGRLGRRAAGGCCSRDYRQRRGRPGSNRPAAARRKRRARRRWCRATRRRLRSARRFERLKARRCNEAPGAAAQRATSAACRCSTGRKRPTRRSPESTK